MGIREATHAKFRGDNIVVHGDLSPGQLTAVTVLLAIAMWNSVEMVPLVFFTFKRFRTLYFWSICAATFGVVVCATSQIISTWGPEPYDRTLLAGSVVSCLGWVPMVTGQSFVLYSRLHLLNVPPQTLKLVLFMIIFDGIVLHSIGTAFTLEPLLTHSLRLERVYATFEKIQVTTFMCQEFVLSGLYLWKCHEFLGQYTCPLQLSPSRISTARRNSCDKVKGLLLGLITANVVVMMLDVTIIALEYAGLHQVQLSYKAFVYALKLKIELSILNQLVGFVRQVHRLQTEADGAVGLEREWQSTMATTFATPSYQGRVDNSGITISDSQGQ
ncbi:hypothetical protein PG993_004006 [Apiospora rasikravindrae]|uniref:DUF7703 domain-containing protein n=1 Tax=Apiospora rasikravindrae TaxID=990691 RepID=A0ABR1TBI6_9PEZI